MVRLLQPRHSLRHGPRDRELWSEPLN
jgi:hypothetical protein